MLRRHPAALALALVALATTVGAGVPSAASPAAASAPSAAVPGGPAVRDGDTGVWWYDAMKLGRWHQETTGEGVTVAVIDGGIDVNVPDLRGADVEKRVTCRKFPLPSGRKYPSWADHGTAMTTLIAGQGTGNAAGGQGVTGVAPGARVLFFSNDFNPRNDLEAECSYAEMGWTVVQAAKEGADVISMSFGGPGLVHLRKYLAEAQRLGAVLVASNPDRGEQDDYYPAAHPGVVAVSAMDESSQMWEESLELDYATITTPGVGAPAGGLLEDGTWVSRGERTGTSGATAITAGALALVKSKYPDATANQLIHHLIHFTGGTRGYTWDPLAGFGGLSVNDMLAHDPTRWPDENPLLVPRSQAVEQYPMSSYDQGSAESADDGPDEAASSPSDAQSAAAGEDSTQAQQESGGFPAWGWLTVAVAAAAVLGVVFLGRRGSRAASAGDQAKGE
jgi:subtilisin family serine protease